MKNSETIVLSAEQDQLAPSSVPLSVVVLAYNEQRNLPACLESLKGLICELVVVDSGSTDRTVALARSYGAKVLTHAFENYARQRDWAQENLPANSPWILHLDADERLTPELVNEINQVLQNPNDEIDGFLFRKRTVFMGRWIRHGGHYPSYHLRLFRRGRGRCEDRLYDQHFLCDGRVKSLRNDYIDVVASSLSTWSVRHTRWAELEAQELVSRQNQTGRVRPRLFGNPIERRRWLRLAYGRAPLFTRGFAYWLYRYFFRLGFLDGKEGLIFHFLQGFWFRFLVDAMIFERQNERKLHEQSRP